MIKPPFVTVVSGLPRSGTSMMMKMLEAGGMDLLADHARTADIDNPNGYYEFERVKELPQGDDAWLDAAQGCAVKIVAIFLPYLPARYEYRVIFMQRSLREVIASQKRMMDHRGASHPLEEEALARLFEKHLQQVDDWMKRQPHVKRLDVRYSDLVNDPLPCIEALNHFLGLDLATPRMQVVIDPSLYRQKAMGETEP